MRRLGCDVIQEVSKSNSTSFPFFPRWITPALARATRDHPVVVLTGARQVGKSTLLLSERALRGWRYQTLDDFDTLRQATERPEALWAGAERVIIDEVQKAPGVLSAVKPEVDRRKGRTRFIVSGSSTLLLWRNVTETLAGRAVYFVLDPMTRGELHRKKPSDLVARILAGAFPPDGETRVPTVDPVPLLLRGSMPALIHLADPAAWIRWWDGYVSTYLERDLRGVSRIDALVDFRRVMQLAALRSGQLVNQTEVARDAKLSQPTVHRYLNLLETTHLFERLPAYARSRTARVLKSPKAFWADAGLPVFLSGYYTADDLRGARELGSFFENLVYHHLRVGTRRGSTSGAPVNARRSTLSSSMDGESWPSRSPSNRTPATAKRRGCAASWRITRRPPADSCFTRGNRSGAWIRP